MLFLLLYYQDCFILFLLLCSHCFILIALKCPEFVLVLFVSTTYLHTHTHRHRIYRSVVTYVTCVAKTCCLRSRVVFFLLPSSPCCRMLGDYPGVLLVDLGAPSQIAPGLKVVQQVLMRTATSAAVLVGFVDLVLLVLFLGMVAVFFL